MTLEKLNAGTVFSLILALAILVFALSHCIKQAYETLSEWDQRVAREQLTGALEAERLINRFLQVDSLMKPMALQQYQAYMDSLRIEAGE